MAPEEHHLRSMSATHRHPDTYMHNYLVERGKKVGSNSGNSADILVTCYMVPGHKGVYMIIFGEQEESNDKTKVSFLDQGVRQRNHNGTSVNLRGKAEGSLVTALALRCLLSANKAVSKALIPLSQSPLPAVTERQCPVTEMAEARKQKGTRL